MTIMPYNQVLLNNGNRAFIVEVFEPDKHFLADVDRDGDTFTEDVYYEDILCVLKGNTVDEDEVKIAVYETQIEDMLKALCNNYDELKQAGSLDDFQQGRKLAYAEMLDIIQTRYRMVWDVLNEDDEPSATEDGMKRNREL